MTRRSHSPLTRAGIAIAMLALISACRAKETRMTTDELTSFATRYAAAWSGSDPVAFGTFYDESAALLVNGAVSQGREAIVATARSFMTAFPDMRVQLDSLRQDHDTTVFHWRWTGTNTGPGGTGAAVDLHGYERWTFAANGLLAKSDGHYDTAEYQRQLTGKP